MGQGEPKLTPQERAQRSADAMWQADEASKWMGMKVDDVGPGHARLSLTVRRDHLNGHGICHGAVIFALADSAFAFACNSYNAVTVAHHNLITFISPGKLGSILTAHAREVSRTGRNGIYDVTVHDEDGKPVAEMRGLSRSVKGRHFEE